MKPETKLSRAVCRFLRLCNCVVYSTEQGYRPERGGTRCTPGIPDLIVFQPAKARFAFVELKTKRNKLNKAQAAFQRCAQASGVESHVWRSVEDAKAWLEGIG